MKPKTIEQMVTEEVTTLLEHEHCPFYTACPTYDENLDWCNDHPICPSFREYVNTYVDKRLIDYLNERGGINESI